MSPALKKPWKSTRLTLSRWATSTAVLLAAGALFTGALVYGVNKGNVPADTKTVNYTVQSGDTVWGIVSRFDTRDDMNAAVQWVDEHNHLNGQISPGEVLIIPIGGK